MIFMTRRVILIDSTVSGLFAIAFFCIFYILLSVKYSERDRLTFGRL